MTSNTPATLRFWAFVIAIACSLPGCQTATQPRPDTTIGHGREQPPQPPQHPPAPQSDAAAPSKIIAYLDGRPLDWNQLLTPLLEYGGGQTLAEFVLETQITRELASRNLTITQDHIAAESDILRLALNQDPNIAERLLRELRERRGLGDHRYKQLLARNAGLRLLVQPEVHASETAIRAQYDLEYGPQFQARLIVVDNLQTAGEVARKAQAGEPFIDLVLAFSTDISRAQAGLLSPISPADPTFPAAVREALTRLQPGQSTDPITLERGFAILQLQRIIQPQPVPLDDVKQALALTVRRQVERVSMQRLAKTLSNKADVLILDPTLKSSWDQQRNRTFGQE
jgi:hypothetical protein